MMYFFQRVTQADSEKRNPSAPRSRTQDLLITTEFGCSTTSHKRLVGAKAIKLGSWDIVVTL